VVLALVRRPTTPAVQAGRAAEVDLPGAALGGIGLRQQPLDRHRHEVGVGGAGGAVGKGDLQHLGQQVHRVGRAEASAGDVEAFQDVQHLPDVQRPGARRRRAGDLEAAVVPRNGARSLVR
jgi:hypothetical protein